MNIWKDMTNPFLRELLGSSTAEQCTRQEPSSLVCLLMDLQTHCQHLHTLNSPGAVIQRGQAPSGAVLHGVDAHPLQKILNEKYCISLLANKLM